MFNDYKKLQLNQYVPVNADTLRITSFGYRLRSSIQATLFKDRKCHPKESFFVQVESLTQLHNSFHNLGPVCLPVTGGARTASDAVQKQFILTLGGHGSVAPL